jgi:hypothetical protein
MSISHTVLAFKKSKYTQQQHGHNNNNNEHSQEVTGHQAAVFLNGPIHEAWYLPLANGGLLKQFHVMHSRASVTKWIPFTDFAKPYTDKFLVHKQKCNKLRMEQYQEEEEEEEGAGTEAEDKET